ncbi:hypothetical protein ZHAS_00022091 [Anopheles sinensis]|uniref:Uncharacterized protein n=1 Tax=Anopheles sinensis TaxID=74873 RepID=A0A084WU20_ANOSI|nr:hypothetical protein ZHAS_00022091 [Anopheles sinensis]
MVVTTGMHRKPATTDLRGKGNTERETPPNKLSEASNDKRVCNNRLCGSKHMRIFKLTRSPKASGAIRTFAMFRKNHKN